MLSDLNHKQRGPMERRFTFSFNMMLSLRRLLHMHNWKMIHPPTLACLSQRVDDAVRSQPQTEMSYGDTFSFNTDKKESLRTDDVVIEDTVAVESIMRAVL